MPYSCSPVVPHSAYHYILHTPLSSGSLRWVPSTQSASRAPVSKARSWPSLCCLYTSPANTSVLFDLSCFAVVLLLFGLPWPVQEMILEMAAANEIDVALMQLLEQNIQAAKAAEQVSCNRQA